MKEVFYFYFYAIGLKIYTYMYNKEAKTLIELKRM
jgi:hypothetical protein